jgi:hypothetical protein
MPLGSFGIFETFRILIPGYLVALYASWYLALFLPRTADYLGRSNLSAITFVGFGLIAGFILYLQKIPGDPKEVQDLLPSQKIFEIASKIEHPVTRSDATDLYFYMLNNYFSDSMRERIFFYGNIYRVAQKTWLLSLFFLVLSLLTVVTRLLLSCPAWHAGSKACYMAALAAILITAYRSAAVRYKEILYGQLFWLEMRKTLVESLIIDGRDRHAKP